MRQTFEETTDPGFGRQHVPKVREAMARQGLDGIIVPHEDEHQNEYLPAANDRLGWISGFTGSAGAAVVLADRAAIFVDGRYTVQVRNQVDDEVFEIRDLIDGGVSKFLEEEVGPGQSIGYDPRLHSPEALDRLRAAAEKSGARMVAVSENPVDTAWGAERPAQPTAAVVPHPIAYAGEESGDKRARLGRALAEKKADAALITAPASVAWLFNIRGGDVIRSPLPLSQAILNADGSADLFVDPAKVTGELAEWLGNKVALRRPEDLPGALAELKGKQVLVDPALSSAWYFDTLENAGAKVIKSQDPTVLARAIKNDTEIEGARQAHIRDGAALARVLCWLASEAQSGGVDEIEVAKTLERFREETDALRDLSFDAITGSGPNGAVIHYRVTEKQNRKLEPDSLLLIDSGGQYLDGTTDVTRTVAIGTPSAEMKARFTLVLKGHLALSRVRFPPGTTGAQLDALARAPLWAAGLDFDHGTGHGVGSYLGVHEGPHNISKRPNGVELKPGMIVSNEPGYYKEGAYGIRIENLQVVTPPAQVEGGERPMLGFEPLTLAPIDRACIDTDLLTSEDLAQLNAYHTRVLATVGPRVDEPVRHWLEAACAPL
jgi:Xaa-Pro aminopeptidase